MKKMNIGSLGLETITDSELLETNGGSLLLIAAVAACCLLLTGCTGCTSDHQEKTQITVEDGGVVVIVNADVAP